MPLHEDTVKEIAQQLGLGMDAYVHKQTHEIHALPNPLLHGNYIDEQQWEDVQQIVDANPDDFVKFEPWMSPEAYKYMVRFTDTISKQLGNQLYAALQRKQPFAGFRDILRRYPDVQTAWEVYKQAKHEDDVRWRWKHETEEADQSIEE